MSVNPFPLRVLQYLKMSADMILCKLIGREEVGCEQGDMQYIMYYDLKATQGNETYQANAL